MKIKYNILHDDLVYEYKLRRLADKEIAKKFGINRNTFYVWLRKYKSFRNSYDEARKTDVDCLKSMRQRATGYDYYEDVAFIYKGEIVKDVIKKHMPGEYKATTYMLKNSGFDAEFEYKKDMENKKYEQDKQVHADKIAIEKEKANNDTGLPPVVFIENSDKYLEWKKKNEPSST